MPGNACKLHPFLCHRFAANTSLDRRCHLAFLSDAEVKGSTCVVQLDLRGKETLLGPNVDRMDGVGEQMHPAK